MTTPEGVPPAKRTRVTTSKNSAKSKDTLVATKDRSHINDLTLGVDDNEHNGHDLTRGVTNPKYHNPGSKSSNGEFIPLRTPGDCVLLRGRTWHMSRPSEPNRFLLKLVVFFKLKKFVRVKFWDLFGSD